jgi:hypothetical protein
MLIVCTDHGYMLGEHGFWAKNYMPPYDEIVHTPLFVWDPRYGKKAEARDGLVQTIDITATILDFFGIETPPFCQGRTIAPLIAHNTHIREAGLFGVHGAHVCCTDGRFVYMKAPISANVPLYNYTLMPTHMSWFFSPAELATMEKSPPFRFTNGLPLMRFNAAQGYGTYQYSDLLFDLAADPAQERPLTDAALQSRMRDSLISLMRDNDAPPEQFERLGL